MADITLKLHDNIQSVIVHFKCYRHGRRTALREVDPAWKTRHLYLHFAISARSLNA